MAAPVALVNADVWTMRDPDDRAQAVLLARGRVQKVGEERAVLRVAHALGARIHDLAGSRIIPGLVDAHTHLIHQGLLKHRVDLRDTDSKEAALRAVRAALRAHRGRGPLIAERWDESRWGSDGVPRRDELDAITRRVPLVLRRIDGHFAVANSPAIAHLAPRFPGVDPDTGALVEEASLNLNLAWPTPVADSEAAALEAQRIALRLGVTTVHDFVVPSYLRAYQRLHRKGRLKIRVRATPYLESLDALAATGLETGLGDDRLALGGVKVFGDGSLGAHTAALREPYTDRPELRGRLNHREARLETILRQAASSGLTPSVHAIGDAAIDQVLAAAQKLPPRRRRGLRIEHFEVHHPDQVAAAQIMGIVLSMQPNFLGPWSRRGGLYEKRLGAARYRRTNELRRLLDAGANLALGSDCMPFDPWFGLEATARAPQARQRLAPSQGLYGYTAGSAASLGHGPGQGRLVPGAPADLCIVRGDWSRRQGLARTHVSATMIGQEWVHGGPPSARQRRPGPA